MVVSGLLSLVASGVLLQLINAVPRATRLQTSIVFVINLSFMETFVLNGVQKYKNPDYHTMVGIRFMMRIAYSVTSASTGRMET